MPTWGEILTELQGTASANNGVVDFDGVRRRYLSQLRSLTGRDVILYSTNWLAGGGPGLSITLVDMQGMMEVCRHLDGPGLDLIIHSPGGSPEATASIVRYLRQKFTNIRAFVPIGAMSAATMWCLACDEIAMGKHSQLGPIDPQLVMPQGAFPARAIIRQFERAVQECAADPSKLGAWIPILQQYGPALLQLCEDAEHLARGLVEEWLATYMFANDNNKKDKAKKVADYFADYETHRSHSLGVERDTARKLGLNILDLEEDQDLQDAVLSVHHATVHTFATGATKIVENHLGRTFVQMTQQQVSMPVPSMAPQQAPAP